MRSVAGELPFHAEDAKPDLWSSSLAADAARQRVARTEEGAYGQ